MSVSIVNNAEHFQLIFLHEILIVRIMLIITKVARHRCKREISSDMVLYILFCYNNHLTMYIISNVYYYKNSRMRNKVVI